MLQKLVPIGKFVSSYPPEIRKAIYTTIDKHEGIVKDIVSSSRCEAPAGLPEKLEEQDSGNLN